MTLKHKSYEYQRNARIVRDRVAVRHRAGEPVPCWRGRGPIMPGMSYDVGHINDAGGHGLANLAPEHRHETRGCCKGNRAHGGAKGAALTNARHAPTVEPHTTTTWNV